MAGGGVSLKTQALPRACRRAQPESRPGAPSWDSGPGHQATVGGAGREGGGRGHQPPGQSAHSSSFPQRGGTEVGCHSQETCHFHQMSRGLFTRLRPLCPVLGAIYKALNSTAQERAPGAPRNGTVASLPRPPPTSQPLLLSACESFILEPPPPPANDSPPHLEKTRRTDVPGGLLPSTAASRQASRHPTYWLGMVCYSR